MSPETPTAPAPQVVQLGRTPGMKPLHAVVGLVLLVVWFGILAFVISDGRGGDSNVDVYSELPPGFTAALSAKGVTYAGLSPVDSATVDAVLDHAPAGASSPSGVDPIVLRTAFSSTAKGNAFQDHAALMVVVPQAASSSASPATSATDHSVYVAFLDPTTYQVLTSLTYPATASS